RQRLVAVVAGARQPVTERVDILPVGGERVDRLVPPEHERDAIEAEHDAEQREPPREPDERNGRHPHDPLLCPTIRSRQVDTSEGYKSNGTRGVPECASRTPDGGIVVRRVRLVTSGRR